MNEMKSKSLSIIVLTTLALALFTAIPVEAADADLKVAVQLKGGLEAGQHLLAAMEDFSNVEWTVVLEDLTASDLADVDMLILIQSDMAVDYTTAEKAAVKTWFQGAGKTVWVCADSDFSDQYLRIPTANDMLENLGSILRGESAEAADPTSNAEGADYRVFGLTENIDPEIDFLANGVTSALVHGPGLIVGYIGDTYYKLEETEIDDVYIVLTTSSDGIVVDFEPPVPELHGVGEEGFLPLLVMEKYANGNVLYAGADSPFAHYTPMYKPEIRKVERYSVLHTQEGAKLFENILNYAIKTKLSAEISGLDSQISTLEGEKTSLQSEVSSLESDKSSLESDVADIESEVADLEGDVATLEGTVTDLEADVAAAQSAASSWQMYAVGALIIGLVVGFFVGPMLKK